MLYQEIDEFIACLSIEEKTRLYREKLEEDYYIEFWNNLGIEVL